MDVSSLYLLSISTVWLRQPWAIYAAPFSFAFDLIGGGEMVRTTIVPTCIAEISRPDKLYVDDVAPVFDETFRVEC